MRLSKVWLLAVLCIALGQCSVFAANKTTDNIQATVDWLSYNPSVGRMTVGEWCKLNETGQLHVLCGLLSGSRAGIYLSGDYECASIERQRMRMYLLQGWKMPASAYITEVTCILEDKNSTPIYESICGAFVKAESSFAKSAGQYARSSKLRYVSSVIEFESDPKNKNDVGSNGLEYWKSCSKYGSLTAFTEGFLNGIDLESARVDASAGSINMGFRVGQYKDEMNQLESSQAPTAQMILLFLKAQLSLMEKASVSK